MEYVNFKIAKKLKEKGYPQEVFIGYDEFGTLCIGDEHSLVCDTPTIWHVLKWLREEKKIHIGFGYSPRKKWRHVVMYLDDRFYNKPTLTVDGFLEIEQAALAGIEYVLDNLI